MHQHPTYAAATTEHNSSDDPGVGAPPTTPMVQSAPGWFVGVIKRGRNAPETGVVEIAVSEPGRDDREKLGLVVVPLVTDRAAATEPGRDDREKEVIDFATDVLDMPLRSPAVMTGKSRTA